MGTVPPEQVVVCLDEHIFCYNLAFWSHTKMFVILVDVLLKYHQNYANIFVWNWPFLHRWRQEADWNVICSRVFDFYKNDGHDFTKIHQLYEKVVVVLVWLDWIGEASAKRKDYFASRKKKVPFSMAIGNGELMHECFPKHSRMGKARMK